MKVGKRAGEEKRQVSSRERKGVAIISTRKRKEGGLRNAVSYPEKGCVVECIGKGADKSSPASLPGFARCS